MRVQQRLTDLERRSAGVQSPGPIEIPDLPTLRTWPPQRLLALLQAVVQRPAPPIDRAEVERLTAIPLDELRRRHREALAL